MKGTNFFSVVLSCGFTLGMSGQTTVTLNPTADNTLYQSTGGNISNGAGQYLFIGTTAPPGNQARRAILRFNVAGSVPAGATITGASLTLVMNRTIAGPQPSALHRLTKAWGEGASNAPGQEGGGAPAVVPDATWIHNFFNAAFWTTPGGDFLAAASAVLPVAGNGPYTWVSPQMVADVQFFLDNPAMDFGWILMGNETVGTTAKRFHSRESPAAANRPFLNITYTLPPPCFAVKDTVEGYNASIKWRKQPNAVRYCIQIGDSSGNSSIKYTTDTCQNFRIPPSSYGYRIFVDTSGADDYSDTSCTGDFDIDCSPFNFDMNVVQPDNLALPGYVRIFNVGNNGEDVEPLYDFMVTSANDTFVQNNKKQHRFPGLPGGKYEAKVTDNFGCMATDSFRLIDLDSTYVPNLIDAKNCTFKGFRPQWNQVPSAFVNRYQASYRNFSLGGPRTIGPALPTSDTTYCFDSLTGGFTYAFYVRSRYNDGGGNKFSPWSGPVFRFLPPMAPPGGGGSDMPKEWAAGLVSAFPNPAEGSLNIFYSRAQGEVSLFDLSGNLIRNRTMDSPDLKLDISNFPSGLYLLKVQDGEMLYSERVVKK